MLTAPVAGDFRDVSSVITGTSGDDSVANASTELVGTAGDDVIVATTGNDEVFLGINAGGTDTLRVDLTSGLELFSAKFVDADATGGGSANDLRFFIEDASFNVFTTTVFNHVADASANPVGILSFIEFDFDEDGATLETFKVATQFNVAGLAGFIGVDTAIAGTDGIETLGGDSGNDIIFANGGADNISGGAGDDLIVGGGGADVISTGLDFDTVLYEAIADSGVGALNRDTIVGFDAGGAATSVDVIDLADVVTGAFSFTGVDTGLDGVTASAFVDTLTEAAKSILKIDVDGNNTVDMEIDITGFTGTLDTGDFFVDPAYTIDDVTVTEGGIATFTVTRTGDISAAATIDYATQDGTASNLTDYTLAPSTTVNFAAGATTATITVQTTDDTLIEGDETFSVVLSNPVPLGDIVKSVGTATIVDNDVNDAPVVDSIGRELVFDDFNDGTLDASVWTTGGAGGGTATETANNVVELTNNHALVSQLDITPTAAEPLAVSATWTYDPDGLSGASGIRVWTRTDGVPDATLTDLMANGLAFSVGDTGAVTLIDMVGGTFNSVTLGSLPFALQSAQSYTLEVFDDGTNVEFTITDTLNPANTFSAATATVAALATPNKVAFQVSGGAGKLAFIDDVTIGNEFAPSAAIPFDEDTVLDGQVFADDADGDTLTFSLPGGSTDTPSVGFDQIATAKGTVALNRATGEFTFTPTADATGAANFQVAVSDGIAPAVTQVVNLDIAPVNDAPTLTGAPLDVIVTEDTLSNVDLSAVVLDDVDGDPLTVTLFASSGTFAAPADGALVGAGVTETLVSVTTITLAGSAADINAYLDTVSNIQYTPATGITGDNVATITVTANDGTVTPTLATINVDVVNIIAGTDGVNDALVGTTGDDRVLATTGTDTIDLATNAGGVDTLEIGTAFFLEGVAFNGTDLAFTIENIVDGTIHTTTVLNHAAGSLSFVEFDFDEDGTTLETYAINTASLGAAIGVDTMLISTAALGQFLTGNTGNDILIGNDGDDTLNANGGNDFLDGGIGADALSGDAGDDFLLYDAADTSVDGGAGTDTLLLDDATLAVDLRGNATVKNIEQIDLEAGFANFSLTLNAAAVAAMTDAGNTLTITGDASDSLVSDGTWYQVGTLGGFTEYTSGATALRVQTGIVVTGLNVAGGQAGTLGNDADTGTVATDTYFATSGADTYATGGGGDAIVIGSDFFLENAAFDGADLVLEYEDILNFNIHTLTILGHSTNSISQVQYDIDENGTLEFFDVAAITTTFDGTGSGNNKLVVGDISANTITGSSTGRDAIFAGGGNDTITAITTLTSFIDGGAGDDTLTGGAGADTFFFTDGNDTFNVTAGGDTVEVDEGFIIDSAFRDSTTNDITFNLLDPVDAPHSILIVGNTDANAVTIEADFDEDQVHETYLLAETNTASTFTVGALVMGDNNGLATDVTGSGFDDLLIGDINGGNIAAGGGNDMIVDNNYGGVTGNSVNGELGNDTIFFQTASVGVAIDLGAGGFGATAQHTIAGVENVIGSDFADTLNGDGLANTLFGEDGADRIAGGGGADTLSGGAGNDVFIYNAASDTGVGAAADTITDFDAGGRGSGTFVDQIDVSGFLGVGQTFEFLGLNVDLTLGTGTGDVRATFNTQTRRLDIDADITAGTDVEIELQNVNEANLDNDDFIAIAPSGLA